MASNQLFDRLSQMRFSTNVQSPFVATQQAVANRLTANRNAALQNRMNLFEAEQARRGMLFDRGQELGLLSRRFSRAARRVGAEETLAFNRKIEAMQRDAARKRRRRGLVSQGLGALGGIAGGAFGSVGGVIGKVVGGLF